MELSFSRKVNTGLIWKIQYARSFRYNKWEHTNSINRQPMKWYIMFLKPLKLKWKKQFTPHEMRLSDGKSRNTTPPAGHVQITTPRTWSHGRNRWIHHNGARENSIGCQRRHQSRLRYCLLNILIILLFQMIGWYRSPRTRLWSC